MRKALLFILSALMAVLFFVPSAVYSSPSTPNTLNFIIAVDSPSVIDRILYRAFQDIGYTITMDAAPMSYALQMVNNGERDGLGLQMAVDERIHPNLIKIPESITDVKFQAYTRADQNKKITAWEDLAGLRVGMLYQKFTLVRMLPENIAGLVQKESHHDLFAALLAGECDIVFSMAFDCATPPVPPLGVVMAGALSHGPTFSHLNKKYAHLVPLVAESIRKMKTNGEYEQIVRGEKKDKSAPKIVLHISSYYPEDLWDSKLQKAMKNIFSRREDIVYYNIPLYSNRFTTTYEQAKNAYSAVRTMFLDAPPDIIVASDNSALFFVSEFYNVLFNNIPIIFCGISGELNNLWQIGKHYAGMWETLSTKQVVDLMLKLYPKTRSIFVVNDFFDTGSSYRKEMERDLASYKGRLEITYNDDVPLGNMLESIRNLPINTMVLLGNYASDRYNIYTPRGEVQRQICQASFGPIFSLTNVGMGALGGRVINPDAHGEFSARMAVSALDGIPMSNLESVHDSESFNKWVFDVTVMKEYSIDESRLPDGSVYVNKKPSMYEANPQAFVLFVVLLFLAMLIITVLVAAAHAMNVKNRRLLETQKSLHTAEELRAKDKAIMEASAESTRILEELLNSMDSLIYVTDAKTDRMLFINKSIDTLFNLNGTGIGEVCWKVLRKDRDSECGHCLKARLKDTPGDAVLWEENDWRSDRYFRHSCKLLKWPEGRVVHFRESVEITDVRLTELDLERVWAIVDNSPQIVAFVDHSMRLEFCNPATTAVSGYTSEELLEHGVGLMHSPETMRRLHEELFPATLSKGKITAELSLRRKDGIVLTMDFSFFTIPGKYGAGIGAIASDVTERKKLADDLVAARDTAEKASNAKSVFLSNMSHELRTPMTALMGMLNMARDSDDLDRIRACLDRMELSSRNLLGIINDILDMSKIESGKLELSCEPFDLDRTLADLMHIMRVSAKEKKQTILVNIDHNVPRRLEGDSMRLAQVIINLLSNAIKFSETGKEIRVEIKLEERNENSALLRFLVIDKGMGISQEHIGNLFQPFQQADNSITKRFGGTGLGLAISRTIVEMMGGQMLLTSTPGKGSTFSFTVRFGLRTDDELRTEEAKPVVTKTSHVGARALVVEDIDINREIIRYLLESAGMEVEEAENGRDAVDLFERDPEAFDVIIMDIQMPVMDGYTATRAIRGSAHSRGSLIPIIAMTANAFSEDVDRALAAGMNGHLSKPINNAELFETLARYL